MTLKLKDKNKKTLVDIEIYVKTENRGQRFIELRSVVVIDAYSSLLLNNIDKADEIIDTFQSISELRGWLWETYFMGEHNDPEKLNDVIKEVSSFLKDVAIKYDLNFVTD